MATKGKGEALAGGERGKAAGSCAPGDCRLLSAQEAVFEAATVGLLLTSDRRYRRVNRSAAELLGCRPEDLIGQPGARIFPSEAEYVLLSEQAAGRLREGLPFAADARLRRSDGSLFWARLSARAVGYGAADLGTLWIIQDISTEKYAQDALQKAMQELYGILNTAVVGIALLRKRKIDRCNTRLEEIFGFAPGEMSGCSTRVWYPSEAVYLQVGEQVYGDLAAGREARMELELRRRDGSLFWGRIAGRAFDPADPYAGSVWIVEDLTAEQAAKEQLLLARKVFEVNSEAIVITDAQNRIVSVNAAFQAITGYSEAEVVGRDPKIMSSGRHDAAFFQDLWRRINDEGHWSGEIWDKRKDGSLYPKWMTIDTIRDEAGRITHHVAVFSDITERKATEERVHFLAHHDALTGLPNRVTLMLHLEHALSQARREGERMAVMFIDLDNFKRINDTLGHHVGDLLLCEVARRIRGAVRDSDIVARIGGDEFVMVLERGHLPGDAAMVAQKIIDRLNQPYRFEGQELHTSPSIGICVFPEDGLDIETLMKNADTAMYHAKGLGRNNFQFYAAEMNAAATQRLQLEMRLRAAVARRDEFLLHYQPQVDLASGRVTGVEALIRWQPPDHLLVMPSQFIPLAEEIGVITHIGDWVLREACAQARAWLDGGVPFGRVAVNISPYQFRQRRFPHLVAAILRESGLPAHCLELEITEGTLMETAEAAVDTLIELKHLGVGLAIDDFGTGYSSLAYLKRFPLDRLKIDRSFVMDIEIDPSDATIAQSVIALARALGLETVAEGVETPGQLAFLRTHGCGTAQGYHFSRPVAPAEAEKFCRGA